MSLKLESVIDVGRCPVLTDDSSKISLGLIWMSPCPTEECRCPEEPTSKNLNHLGDDCFASLSENTFRCTRAVINTHISVISDYLICIAPYRYSDEQLHHGLRFPCLWNFSSWPQSPLIQSSPTGPSSRESADLRSAFPGPSPSRRDAFLRSHLSDPLCKTELHATHPRTQTAACVCRLVISGFRRGGTRQRGAGGGPSCPQGAS